MNDLTADVARDHANRMGSFSERLAWARAWRIRNKPYFDALYGPETPGVAAYPQAVATEPRRWREENRARFDAMYGGVTQ